MASPKRTHARPPLPAARSARRAPAPASPSVSVHQHPAAAPKPATTAHPEIAALLPPTRYTVRGHPTTPGCLPIPLPTDTAVTLRGLAALHGRSVDLVVQAALVAYLGLTRLEQDRVLALQPARPVVEHPAWGGITSDGGLLAGPAPPRTRPARPSATPTASSASPSATSPSPSTSPARTTEPWWDGADSSPCHRLRPCEVGASHPTDEQRGVRRSIAFREPPT